MSALIRKKVNAWTLTEILVVLCIVGILILLALPVEELTLYLIAENKKNRDHQKRIEQLEKKINKFLSNK